MTKDEIDALCRQNDNLRNVLAGCLSSVAQAYHGLVDKETMSESDVRENLMDAMTRLTGILND